MDKLVQKESAGDELEADSSSKPSKKLPDYEQLQRETQLFDIQVQEFYTGSFKYPTSLENEEERTAEVRECGWGGY